MESPRKRMTTKIKRRWAYKKDKEVKFSYNNSSLPHIHRILVKIFKKNGNEYVNFEHRKITVCSQFTVYHWSTFCHTLLSLVSFFNIAFLFSTLYHYYLTCTNLFRSYIFLNSVFPLILLLIFQYSYFFLNILQFFTNTFYLQSKYKPSSLTFY